MNAAINKIKIDENATERLHNTKKTGIANGGDAKRFTKRAALGDLQNRALPRTLGTGKETALKESVLCDIRNNAKARVDTHWKKGELSNDGTAVAPLTTRLQRAVQPAAASETTAGVKVTRSVSQRLSKLGPSGSGTGNLVKPLTTRLVENKVQHVKVIKKVTVDTKLRREDSDVSRRSINKIKAAFMVNSKDGITKAATQNTNSGVGKGNAVVEQTVTLTKTVTTTTIYGENAATTKPETAPATVKIEELADATTASRSMKDVVDIDQDDKLTLILVSEYVNEIYDYLFSLENQQPVYPDHLAHQSVVKPKMRAVLLDWIVEVHEQFHLSNETYLMAVGIIDRYLQKVSNTSRSMLQLVGATALLIAAKYEDVYPPAMSDFTYITDDAYTAKQLMDMELKIFRTLDYNLSRPVSIHFLRRFSKAAEVEDFEHAMSKYFLELATISYDLASFKPSEIAAASLFLTLHLSRCDAEKGTGFNNDLWTPTICYYSRYTASQLRPITQKIAAVARNAPASKLCAVYKKYQKPKYYKVSLRKEMYGALMDSLTANV